MAGILDYIKWRGDLTFDQSELNNVDNLILTRLAYIDYDDLKNGAELLSTVSKRYLSDETKMDIGLFLTEDSINLLESIKSAPRFNQLLVKDFVNIIDESHEVQFSAVTFEINKREAYVAFRGTDDSIVGWKEDFNMTFMDVVPAQQKALEYLQEVMKKNRYKKVYVGGHSKGGNLAVYAAINLDKKLKKRIETVYNNDGPGFKKSIIGRQEYIEIQDRIITLVPQSSIVGLLLEHEEDLKIIESSKKGIMQHDGFSWEVMGNDFVYLSEIDDDGVFFNLTAKRTLKKMTEEQRETFGNILFDIIAATESKTLTDLSVDSLKKLIAINKRYYQLDEESRKFFDEIITIFFDESYKSFLQVTELDQLQEKFNAWGNETKKELDSFFKSLVKKDVKEIEEA
jgi:hypothetical protein